MKDPKKVNLMTPQEVRANGWTAEARDADGHLMTTHDAFSSAEETHRYMTECQREGWTLTVWPRKAS